MKLINFFKKARVYVAATFLVIASIALALGGIPLAIFLLLLIWLGTKELSNIMHSIGFRPHTVLILTMDFIFVVFATLNLTQYMNLAISTGVIAAFLIIMSRGAKGNLGDVATTILGFLYGGWLPMHILLVRNLGNGSILEQPIIFSPQMNQGLELIILMFLVITTSDIAGYYIGKKFGKKPICPELSPKKTIQGSIASTIGGIVIAGIYGCHIGIGLTHSLISGLLMTLAAQSGDIAESMLKRDAGVKDSSNLLPGHGGILDRADSYVFTSAVAYYYFSLLVIG